ncbi:MAG: hypothetical protein JRE20_04680 [Deltaproteobacteria bacterium]|jgi:hypothetical protein|nr:hypothetical protein [Deltaproteobacteria bacterium]
MKIRILNVAQVEFNEAKEYYEIEQTGVQLAQSSDQSLQTLSQYLVSKSLPNSQTSSLTLIAKGNYRHV